MTSEERIEELQALGYNRRESAFLELAALHSGFLLQRQYRTYTGCSRPTVSLFTSKMVANGDAVVSFVSRPVTVYHLTRKRVYAAVGDAESPHRRPREPLGIKAKLMALDYVVAHHERHFLATEAELIDHFTAERGIERDKLPVTRYRTGAGPLHFADKYPIAVAGADPRAGEHPIFCYVDPGEASLDGFTTYLSRHRRLFEALGAARITYVSDRRGRFAAAAQAFERFCRRSDALSQSRANRLLQYFRARAVHEHRVAGVLTKEILDNVREGRAAFRQSCFDVLFDRWSVDGDDAVRAALDAECRRPEAGAVAFDTWHAAERYDIFGTVWRTPELGRRAQLAKGEREGATDGVRATKADT
jgi:hypothetical protein